MNPSPARSPRFRSYLLVFLVGAVTLVVILDRLGSSGALPSLGQYLASSTEALDAATTSSPTASPAEILDPQMLSEAITAPKGVIRAFLATSTADQERGLGGRDALPRDAGMLFVFSSPGEYGFWMKDMRFALDMVWIGGDKKVAGVTRNISPGTFPDVFLPSSPISYVLELNAGASDIFGIATGTLLRF